MSDDDSIYLLTSSTGIKEFYEDGDEAAGEARRLEDKYPPEELGFVLYEIPADKISFRLESSEDD